MANAPACNISVNETINQPPGVRLPNIPPATDLNSALSAIQALSQMVGLLSGQVVDQRGPPGQQGAAGQPGKNNQNKVGRWQEVNRAVQEVTMDSTDGSVTFTFKQINQLTLKDTITGELWVWQRGG
jgi:hypothetical protein